MSFCSTNRPLKGGLLNKSSCLAPVLGVAKFTKARHMIFVTLCCVTLVRLRCLTNPPLSFSGIVRPPVCLSFEEVAVFAGNKVLMELNDKSALIVSDPQGILSL